LASSAGGSWYRGGVVRGLAIAALLVGLTAAATLGLGAKRAPDPAAMACPPGQEPQPARAERLRALLAATGAGTALVSATPRGLALICFGAGAPPQLGPDGVVTLDASAPDPDLAARLGHLLHHLGDPPWVPGEPAPCALRVERALAAERRADAVEAALRSALGLPALGADVETLRHAYESRCAEEPTR
jgi:hypothetical protein